MKEIREKTFVFPFESLAVFLKTQSELYGQQEAIISVDVDTGEKKDFLRRVVPRRS